MPRGTSFSEMEQVSIKSYREAGLGVSEIAAKLNRHRNSISNFLKNPDNYGKTKRTGPKPKVDERAKRSIKRLATEKNMSANQIKQELSLNVTKRRVQQILSEDINLRYEKRSCKPMLLPRHKQARLNFAEKFKFWEDEWQLVIFSDEKKFNLDGPDGYQKYWRDVRQPRQHCFARNFQGGSLMSWGAFSYRGKVEICFISHKMNAAQYVELLDSELVSSGENFHGDNWTFQQDNAPIHSAKHTKDFLNSRGIPTLQWPAVSPDLNPMENLWSILSQNVYKNGRQFHSLKDLRSAIKEEWNKIDVNILQNLVRSMPRRLCQVIINNGGHINY